MIKETFNAAFDTMAAQLVGCKPEAIKRLALRTLYPAITTEG